MKEGRGAVGEQRWGCWGTFGIRLMITHSIVGVCKREFCTKFEGGGSKNGTTTGLIVCVRVV